MAAMGTLTKTVVCNDCGHEFDVKINVALVSDPKSSDVQIVPSVTAASRLEWEAHGATHGYYPTPAV